MCLSVNDYPDQILSKSDFSSFHRPSLPEQPRDVWRDVPSGGKSVLCSRGSAAHSVRQVSLDRVLSCYTGLCSRFYFDTTEPLWIKHVCSGIRFKTLLAPNGSDSSQPRKDIEISNIKYNIFQVWTLDEPVQQHGVPRCYQELITISLFIQMMMSYLYCGGTESLKMGVSELLEVRQTRYSPAQQSTAFANQAGREYYAESSWVYLQ